MPFDAERFRELRVRGAQTQRQFANQLGVTQGYVSKLESGRVEPSIFHLQRIARTFDIPLHHLLRDETTGEDANRPSGYRSVFISYGGPDERFARAIYEEFTRRGVRSFFFPESAVPGKRLHRTMLEGVNDYDRVLLICSRTSLNRFGVLNELEQVLAREAREGGAELLIPITLDDYVFSGWSPQQSDIVIQIRDRVVADFRNASPDSDMFASRLMQLFEVLQVS